MSPLVSPPHPPTRGCYLAQSCESLLQVIPPALTQDGGLHRRQSSAAASVLHPVLSMEDSRGAVVLEGDRPK